MEIKRLDNKNIIVNITTTAYAKLLSYTKQADGKVLASLYVSKTKTLSDEVYHIINAVVLEQPQTSLYGVPSLTKETLGELSKLKKVDATEEITFNGFAICKNSIYTSTCSPIESSELSWIKLNMYKEGYCVVVGMTNHGLLSVNLLDFVSGIVYNDVKLNVKEYGDMYIDVTAEMALVKKTPVSTYTQPATKPATTSYAATPSSTYFSKPNTTTATIKEEPDSDLVIKNPTIDQLFDKGLS